MTNQDACLMIAPICADCGREIDKTPAGWVHVLDQATTWRDGGGMSSEAQAEMEAIDARSGRLPRFGS